MEVGEYEQGQRQAQGSRKRGRGLTFRQREQAIGGAAKPNLKRARTDYD